MRKIFLKKKFISITIKKSFMKNDKKKNSINGLAKRFYNLSIINSKAQSLQKKLKLASMPDNPQVIAAKSFTNLFLSIVGSVILAIPGFIFLFKFKYTDDHVYMFLSMMLLMVSAFLPVISYLLSSIDISHRITLRRVGIESETPAFSALFLVFLRSGLSMKSLFENIASSSSFIYLSEVSTYILKRIEYFGESVEKSFSEAKQTIPSDIFNRLIDAYTTAIETGAPVYETMEAKIREMLRDLESNASRVASNLSGLGQGYITWLSSGFILLLLMLVLRAVFPLLSNFPIGVWGVIIVVLLPAVNIIFIWAADQMQLKFPEKSLKADKLFMKLLPLGFILGFVLMMLFELIISKLPGQIPVSPQFMLSDFLTLDGSTQEIPATLLGFATSFIIITIFPYLSAKKEMSKGTGYDEYVASFLRAVAEGLRTGLSPEKVLESLKDSKELGKFRDILEKIDVLIKYGYPLKDAFKKASELIMDFPTRITFTSLSDMLEIGSLTPETIEILADQIETQIRIRKQYYSKIKSMMYILYAGTILVLVTTVLLSSIIFSLIHGQSSSFLLAAQASVPRVIYITAIASIFNALTTGLLIGKMATGRISNGYMHVGLLVALTTVLILVSLMIRFSFGPSSPINL